MYIVCKVRQTLTGEQYTVCISTAIPCGHLEARLSCCVLLLAFALRPLCLEAWFCLHIQTNPLCKSFHLFLKCTFLMARITVTGSQGKAFGTVCDLFGSGLEEAVEEKRRLF